MENFFIDENFYSDLQDLIEDISQEDDLSDLGDDWKVQCAEGILQPVTELSAYSIIDSIPIERLGEDDKVFYCVRDFLNKAINFNSINEAMPKFYYAEGNDFTITKQDLLDYIKE